MSTQLSPEAAALLFLTPNRGNTPEDTDSDSRPPYMLPTPNGKVAIWTEGQGKVVLMVHGWSGKRSDLAAFRAPLVAAGCKVVSIDLPAHGRSDGETASIPEIADAIRAVTSIMGPVHGVVAHSVGCAAAALALQRGLPTSRAVLVAPPARYAHFARAFSKHVGVDPEAVLDAIRRRGIDIDSIDLPLMAPRLSGRALIIHSKDDQVVPFANGQAIAAAWPHARFLECDGLGHGRILADPGVVAAAVSFLIK